MHEPKLLILDEPFSGLDPINVEEFMKMINELKNKGTSIIFSSHRMEHVELFCDELVILVHGKSVLQGNLKDIKKKYRKKNIQLCCKGDVDKLKDIDGVLDIIKEAGTDTYIIKISDDTVIDKVFEVVKTFKSVTKFNVEEATLNEIFISKVGEAYEK